MNYMLFMCKNSIINWFRGAKRGCVVCQKEFDEFADYMIENHIF